MLDHFFNRTPASDANRSNNAGGDDDRAARWRPARDAVWALCDDLLPDGGTVCVVGAGNVHDVPLTRLARRASAVSLIDLDASAMRRAVQREDPELAARVTLHELDVTGGAADRVVRAAKAGRALGALDVDLDTSPLPGAPYDLVIGDLLYSQLLFPGLKRLGVDRVTRTETLTTHGPRLTTALVQRLERSVSSTGHAVHLHDIACWTAEAPQPASVEEALADPAAVVPRLYSPTGCDPDDALRELGVPVLAHAWWRWPFATTATYLVRASVRRVVASSD